MNRFVSLRPTGRQRLSSIVCGASLLLSLAFAPSFLRAATTAPDPIASLLADPAASVRQQAAQPRIATILDNGAGYARPQVRRGPFLDNQIERGLLRLEFFLRRGVNAVSRSLNSGRRNGVYHVSGCQLGCVAGDGGRGGGRHRAPSSQRLPTIGEYLPLDLPFTTYAATPLAVSSPVLSNSPLPGLAPVPLPPAAPLLVVAIGGLSLIRRRRK